MNKTLITSALPYANGPLHFGHIAGAYLPADAYARACRLIGDDVLYICGSDEYGIAITMSADLAGRTPKEQVDLFHEINKNFFKQLNISFDHYSRTTWEGHKEPVQQYFKDLLANGFIEEKVTDQLYSEADKKFLADRYVVGTCPRCGFAEARGDECTSCGASYEATDLKNPRSKLTNAPLVHKETKHWFLMLDKFKERLLKWLEEKDWKPNVINFVKGYVEDLRPRAITRDSTWGIPIPLEGTEGKVLYVWFDAPIGYISATMEWNKEKWKDYWLDPKTKLVNFIGKDNIPFHAAIFPAMTMGQNTPYKLVDELPANEFYNLEGRQFSKSDGWYIDLERFFKSYSTDQIRYTIAANAPETSDAEFTWKDFQNRCNIDLLGKYGNLVNRVLVFAKNNCAGISPGLDNLSPIDLEFLETIRKKADEAKQAYLGFKMRRASQIVMELAQAGNIYFDTKKPWVAAKNPETHADMKATIACCLECLKALALISSPIIPASASKVWQMLGYGSVLEKQNWEQVIAENVPSEQVLMAPEILFRKVEDEEIAAEVASLQAMAKKAKEPKMEQVTIDDVRKLDLRIATVVAAEAVPSSKKLLKLTLDLGSEKREIVSGIKLNYSPEAIVGKKVLVVANLKEATVMGVKSQGMLLAASHDDKLEIVTILDAPPGSKVS